MDTLQKRIEKFKKHYSKHLECFLSDNCGTCPLNEGVTFGMFCDLYFSAIFETGGVVTCNTRREMCIKILKEEYVNHRINKI